MGCGNSKKQPFALDPHPEVSCAVQTRGEEGSTVVTRLEDFHVQAGLFTRRFSTPVTDRYIELETLGQGSSGRVMKVEHRVTREVRAVKVSEDPRLAWEAEVLSGLDHPNVVKLFELGVDGTATYLVEEFCAGGELLRHIQNSGRFHELEAACFIRQALCAVAYCHERHIVHRDIKPENLLMASSPAGVSLPTLKLIDFGSSCVLHPPQKEKQRVGSLLYMSPEMVRGQSYDCRTDIWSCGVILYILLTGFPPFTGTRDSDIERKIIHGSVVFPLPDSQDVSQEAKKLVLHMLNRNMEMRWNAQQCLCSPWFSATDFENSFIAPGMQRSLSNIGTFPPSEKLKSAFFGFIAANFSTREDLQGLEETFRSLDKDGDGRLTRSELLCALQKAVPYYTAQSFTDEIMRKVDTAKVGAISYSQFLMAAADKSILLSEAILKAAFDTIDLDGSGKISVEELKDLMKTQAELSEEVLTELIQQADDNGDGEIEFTEFLHLMQSPPVLGA